MIFLKSPNPVFGTFLTIFGHSCPMGFFPKNLAVTHNYIWARNTMLSFRKKLMSQFQANLQANRWMDGRTDKPYFIGPFWPRPAVKKAKKKVNNNSTQFNPNSTFWKTKQIQWKDTSIFIYLFNHDHHCYMQKLEVSDILLETCFEMDGLWFTKHRFLYVFELIQKNL